MELSSTLVLVGTLPGYGQVWYHPEAVANLISLQNVKNKFKVTYDSKDEDCFIIHKPDGIRKFKATTNGLYALQMIELSKGENKDEFQFLQTVEDNKSRFSQQAIKLAKKAKDLYGIVQYPSIKDFKEMIRHNLIKNCPVKLEDVDNMVNIFGPSIAALKGKTVRKKSPPVKNPDYIKMPSELESIKKKLVVEANIIYIMV